MDKGRQGHCRPECVSANPVEGRLRSGTKPGDRCIIPRTAALSRICGTMVHTVSAYLKGRLGNNLECRIPRSLSEVTEHWAEPPLGTMMPINGVTPRAPSNGDLPISLACAEFIDFMLEYCYSAKI
jgi:hypothetical protein